MKIGWRHPLVLLLIASVLGGIGWAVRTYVFERQIDPQLDRSALRAEIQRPEQAALPSTHGGEPSATVEAPVPGGQHTRALPAVQITGPAPHQAIGLSTAQPTFAGQTLYCDTVKVTLILAHNHAGERPLLVTNLTIHSEVVPGAPSDACHVDPLSSRPAGIAERNVYLLTLNPDGVSGTYLRSGRTDDAWPVSPTNLLVSDHGSISVSLRPGEEPTAFDFFITSHTAGVRRIWFEAQYDADGERTSRTAPLLLGDAGS